MAYRGNIYVISTYHFIDHLTNLEFRIQYSIHRLNKFCQRDREHQVSSSLIKKEGS